MLAAPVVRLANMCVSRAVATNYRRAACGLSCGEARISARAILPPASMAVVMVHAVDEAGHVKKRIGRA